MKIASTTADFESYVEKRSDVCEILPMMAASGFKHIDLNMYRAHADGSPLREDCWEKWVYDIADTAARLGLDFVQAHSSDSVYDEGEKKDYLTSLIKRELEVCRMLGIPTMTVHGISKKDGERGEFMERNKKFYLDLLETAEKTGVIVDTENTCHKNAPTYFLFEADDMNELVEKVNHPLFGVCWDVGHAHVDGIDQYKAIMKLGKNLKAVHIHDNFGPHYFGADTHSAPYSGSISYDSIVKGLVDVGYKGYFTLEAYSIPMPKSFLGRDPLMLDGVVYDRLTDLPLEFKIRSENLMLDITRYMLASYDCLEN